MKIYLASPYSHPDRHIQLQRFILAARAAAELIRRDHIVFSPICHSHPIAVHGDLNGDWETWIKQDSAFFDWADELWILKLDGWQESKGIEAECKDFCGPIHEVDPKELGL